MKRLLSIALFLGAILFSSPAWATETCSKTDAHKEGALPVCLAIDAAQTTATSATIDTFGHRNLGVQIWSAAGSSAVVDVECRTGSTAPWYLCYTKSNPDATGVYVSLPRAYQYRVHISTWVSGIVSVNFERYNY